MKHRKDKNYVKIYTFSLKHLQKLDIPISDQSTYIYDTFSTLAARRHKIQAKATRFFEG